MSDRPFKVLGIQQIAIGGLDKSKLSRLWIDTLGLTLTGNFRSERENVDEDIAAIGSGLFKVEVDLMQPIDPNKAPKNDDWKGTCQGLDNIVGDIKSNAEIQMLSLQDLVSQRQQAVSLACNMMSKEDTSLEQLARLGQG